MTIQTTSDRAAQMLRVAATRIRNGLAAAETTHYDGADCDGYCIADDCESAADDLADRIAALEAENERLTLLMGHIAEENAKSHGLEGIASLIRATSNAIADQKRKRLQQD